MKALLELKNLIVRYGEVDILKNLTLDIEEGLIGTLVGANGAGKTTTLRAISGLKLISEGEIWFEGQKVDGFSPLQVLKAGIAHCPEGRRVFYEMSTLDNLKIGAYMNRKSHRDMFKKNLEKVYEHFPVLKAKSNQKAGNLSGGQQQMLAVARSLMSNPKALLLDEPSLGLAPIIAQEIFSIIRQINYEGTAILLVEQNANLALRVASKAFVLERGRIVLEGKSEELLESDHMKKAYLGL